MPAFVNDHTSRDESKAKLQLHGFSQQHLCEGTPLSFPWTDVLTPAMFIVQAPQVDVERLPPHVLVEHEYVRAGTDSASPPPIIHEVFSLNRTDNTKDTMGKGNKQGRYCQVK